MPRALTICAALLTTVAVAGLGPLPQRGRLSCGRPVGQWVVYGAILSDTDPFTIASARAAAGRLLLRISGLNSSGNFTSWTTFDGGNTWTRTKPSAGLIDSTHSNGWPAPSDSRIVYTPPGWAFMRSEDGGRTWHVPRRPEVSGRSWTDFCRSTLHVSDCTPALSLVAISPRDPLTVYAQLFAETKGQGDRRSSRPAIYVSHDGGRSWTFFTDGIWGREPMGLSPLDPRIMYAVKLERPNGKRVIVKTSDGGKHWLPVGQYKALGAVIHWKGETAAARKHLLKVNPPSIDVVQWVFDPKDENTLYLISSKGVYRTMNGGSTWRLLDFGYDAWRGVTAMVLNPADSRQMFISTFIGVFRSDEGGCHFVNITPADAWRYSPSQFSELGYRPIAPVLHPAPPSNPPQRPIPGPKARKRLPTKKPGVKIPPPEVPPFLACPFPRLLIPSTARPRPPKPNRN